MQVKTGNLLDLDEDGSSSPLPVTELVTLSIKECFIYKVPPLRSASGHRAEEWDLANPLFTGCLRVYQADTKMRIVIYGYKDPNHMVMNEGDIVQFGECPVEIKPSESITTFVDGVVDSSRYYVVRIKDPKSSRTTLIGVGFREREQAFDFKNCLNEYIRYIDRVSLADKLSKLSHEEGSEGRLSGDLTASSTSSSNKSDNPNAFHFGADPQEEHQRHEDMTAHRLTEHITPLKEGEKIKVKLNLKKKSSEHSEIDHEEDPFDSHHSHPSSISSTPSSGGKGFALKPPPAAAAAPPTTVFTNLPAAPATTNNAADDDWGDFQS